jgi:OmpA-OmpF porin, OOP family
VRIGVPTALLTFCVPAVTYADEGVQRVSPLEASAFLGVDYYGDETGLGQSPAPEQRPQTAPTFGGRVTYIFASLGSSNMHLDLGGEAEASFTASWTGYGFDGPRPSYFAPVIGLHGNILVRLGGRALQPHITVGGGAETVVSSSPFMARDTDPLGQWGLGASFQLGPRWQLRFDARQGVMEAIDGNTTLTYEASMSIGARIGVPSATPRTERVVVAEPPVPEPPPAPRDSDNDGILDPADKCVMQPEHVNGIEDDDGCPERDTDADGLVDPADKCPDRPEDVDSFEDTDGCPDDDNDQDGVLDAKDKCPLEPETKNGFTDDDGCKDDVPAEITAGLAEARKTTFEKGRGALTAKGKAALDKALVLALKYRTLKLTLIVHPEAADQVATDLATKRVAVAKFYLTENGLAMGNLTTQVGAPIATKKDPLVELVVTP